MNTLTIHLLIMLATSHFIAHFFLKTKSKANAPQKHLIILKDSVLAAVLVYLACGLWTQWFIPVVTLITYGIIDFIVMKRGRKIPTSFITDQCAHLMVVGILGFTAPLLFPGPYQSIWYGLWGNTYLKILVLISGYIVTSKGIGIYVGLFTAPYLDQFRKPEKAINPESRGFENGGRIIGALERSLIFIFILFLDIKAIGFLIAAKSIFRFGELKNSDNRMEAEYIIIGTLLSFLLGITSSLLTKWILRLL